MNSRLEQQRIAVLLPCYNEAGAISDVVAAFRDAFPKASIFVYDNNSTDDTAVLAAAAGATVRHESYQGKGHVVRRMFADVDADVYVMADGDGTYDASSAAEMLRMLSEQRLDMVVGTRMNSSGEAQFRAGHRFGNRLFTAFVGWLFGRTFTDILSGYRVFSRRFVKSFPVLSTGFEIETELTVHALQMHMPVGERDTVYGVRALGSQSKLNTYSDGLRIAWTIMRLFKQVRPVLFFSALAVVLAAASVVLAWPIFTHWLATGLVPRLPTAVLATGMMLLASLAVAAGWVLESVAQARLEAKRLAYLAIGESPRAGH